MPVDSPDPTDVLRRLRVIESALGLDLQQSGCTGMPLTCQEPACGLEACPTVHNRISQALDGSDRVQEQMDVLEHLVSLLREQGLVTTEMVRIAQLRAEIARLKEQIRRGRELERMVGKVGVDLASARKARLAQLQEQLAEREADAQANASNLSGQS